MIEQTSRATPSGTPRTKCAALATVSLALGVFSLASLLVVPSIGALLPAVRSGLALLFATAFIGCPFALLFGLLALRRIGKSGGQITGRGRAIAGLASGGVGLLLMAAMLLPALASAREKARRVQCMNNLKMIGVAIDFYAQEHNGIVPRKFDDLWPYTSNLDNLLICPSAKDKGKPSYEITLGGGEWKSIDSVDAVVVLESSSDHRSGRYALYGDGHVQFIFNERDSP